MSPQDLMISKSTSRILLHLLLLSLLHQITTAALTDQQLDLALLSLRSHGYTLFPNAISTSDLRFHLLNQTSNATSTFTLFSPPDSLLFSVDLSSTASHYTKSLFLHVSPSRLSMSDFRNLTAASGGTYIDSLVPNHRLLINNSLARLNGTVDGSVLVNRVQVSVPDLFLGPDIAVHGLDGILVAGFDDKVEDTSFEAATSSPANEIWSSELNSPLAVRFPARKRNGKNRRRNGRNGGITRSQHRFMRMFFIFCLKTYLCRILVSSNLSSDREIAYKLTTLSFYCK
ncbi:hypothetical protein OIU77_006764 [Salix suchowensis]|uniref:FAS1 domain-containing protein n=1 Tax=Salix suchowensis TaxID=1278906 RepID=A0ABQ9ALU5_9ROSI|nr:fasciclin arabinogalactan protein [Salix suchowensis]KAJ6296919.1 hypothetical protein OIU78_022611 [Salix suchowensis]KAJ6349244.1 hypothetical protein OIU77_006764 [Salix suchowensis]